MDKAIEEFADDFGYDLDEEGHPMDEGDSDARSPRRDEGASEAEEARDRRRALRPR